ncbi:hypothetical protein [Burkholderia diffusa]|uniref:hypothetical protein n=1 Tax=Burkholderia diffusa TaxID=488732 RepID=UPI002ABDAA06|nr:hypothetical protein [Burkholderia diffusa]
MRYQEQNGQRKRKCDDRTRAFLSPIHDRVEDFYRRHFVSRRFVCDETDHEVPASRAAARCTLTAREPSGEMQGAAQGARFDIPPIVSGTQTRMPVKREAVWGGRACAGVRWFRAGADACGNARLAQRIGRGAIVAASLFIPGDAAIEIVVLVFIVSPDASCTEKASYRCAGRGLFEIFD